MESQGNTNRQSVNNNSWKSHTSKFQILLQIYGNQNSVIWMYRKPQNKPLHIKSNDVQQGCQIYSLGKMAFSTNWTGKLDISMRKNETVSLFHIIYKN